MKFLIFCLILCLTTLAHCYQEPKLTIHPKAEGVSFGHDCLKYFQMGQGYVNLNHGAFGVTCRTCLQKQREYQDLMESDANNFFRGVYQGVLKTVRARVSKYVNADEKDLVMVENVSTGVNSVLRALADFLHLGANDYILHTTMAYPMVVNVMNYLSMVRGVKVLNATIPVPVRTAEDFLEPVRNMVKQYGSKIRVASFDHIVSYPSLIAPIKELVQMLHAVGTIVLVDGAHVLGQIPLDIKAIDADFYVANSHKWMYSPKGSAFLWARPSVHSLVVPNCLNGEADMSKADTYENLFTYIGTRDYTAEMAVGAAMDFRESLGDAEIMSYVKSLAWQGGNLVAEMWGTRLIAPNADLNGALVTVVLPTQNATLADWVRAQLYSQYNTYIQTSSYQGILYVRISAQIYLELSDYETFARRYLELMKKY